MTDQNDQTYLNRTYFLALKAAAAASPAQACARFGVDVETAESVAKMTLEQIDNISKSEQVLFKPVLAPGVFMRIVGVKSPQDRQILLGLASH